nr:putative sugar nucleotidyl transferase [Candidatus Krumholzibacteria bacterium]
MAHFRPVCWSQPVYEQRVGVFNLRERVERLLPVGATGGRLLSRDCLRALHPESPWRTGTEQEEIRGLDSTFLWINGRLAPDHHLLAQVLAMVEKGQSVAWQDHHGTLAFSCSAEENQQLMVSYDQWEQTQADAGVWSAHAIPPQPWTAPRELPNRQWQAAEGLGFIWEVVPATSGAIVSDLELTLGSPGEGRVPFGVFPLPDQKDQVWDHPLEFARWEGGSASSDSSPPVVTGSAGLYLGPEVQLGFGVAVDTRHGPVILDRETVVQPHVFLEGPLYVGPGSTIKSGATIYGESSFGIMNKIAGEIGESTFG